MVNDKLEFINQLGSVFSRDDYVQIMLGYQDYMILFGNGKCMYYHNLEHDNTSYVNSYLNDERRSEFPYSTIPEHVQRIGLFDKYHFVNQILDYEKPYLSIRDGVLEEIVSYKDGNKSLIHNKILVGDSTTRVKRIVSRAELDNYLQNGYGSNSSNKAVEMFSDDGRFYDRELPTEEEIIEDEKEFLLKALNYQRFNDYRYEYRNRRIYNELEQLVSVLEKVEPIYWSPYFLLTIMEDGSMHLEYIKFTFLDFDKYELETVEIPITKESLQAIKARINSPIKELEKPKISLRLNPNISKEQLKEENKKVLSLKK